MSGTRLVWKYDTWTESKGSRSYLYVQDQVTRMTTRYNIRIERRILESMSDRQLKRLATLAQREMTLREVRRARGRG